MAATATQLRLAVKDSVTAGTFTSEITPITLESVTLTAIEIAQRDDIDITATGDIAISAKNAVFLGSEQDLKLKSVSTDGIVSLKTAGVITNASTGSSHVVHSDDLVLEASGGGIGTAAKPFRIELPADATFTARAKNDIFIVDLAGDLNLETVYSQQDSISLTASNGSIFDVFNNGLDNIKAGKSISLTAVGSIGTESNPVDIDQGAATTSLLTASATGIFLRETLGNMHVDTVDGKTGDVQLEAHQYIRDMDATTSDNTDITGESITLTAINGGIGGLGKELDIESGADATGRVTLSAQLDSIYVNEVTGDLHLNTVGTVGSSTFTFLSALAGKILDARIDPSTKNILSGKVYLFAAQDIGTITQPILTRISGVQGKAEDGKTYLHNTGHLTVGGVLAADDSPGVIATGDVQLTASSPVSIGADIVTAGDITITASESAATGDDITLATGKSITSTGGIIRLNAGDNVTINDGTSISSPHLIEIIAAFDDADSVPANATINLDGALSAPLIYARTGDHDDSISIAAATTISGVAIVEAGAGNDSVTNNASTTFTNPLIVFGDAATIDYDTNTHILTRIDSADAGNGGNDELVSNAGFALLIGGHGKDTLTGGTGTDWAVAGEIEATFAANRLSEVAVTGNDPAAGETLSVGDGTNFVLGGLGSDTITAGTGTNTIFGDEGLFEVDASGNLVYASSINPNAGAPDTFSLGSGTYRVIAGAGNETITLGAGTNYVIGDAGSIEVSGGQTILSSITSTQPGDDIVTVSNGTNVVIGGGGTDTITVTSGASSISSIIGDDGTLTLGSDGKPVSLATTNFGVGARDVISLADGTNAVIGGTGNDQITTGGGTNTVLGDDGFANFTDGAVTLIESTNLGNGDVDTIDLNDGTNIVIAGAKSDIINMGGGTNFVFADEGRRETTATNIIAQSLNASDGGKDQITVGPGYNVIAGGADEDTITVNGSTPTARGIVLGDNGEMTLDLAGNLLDITSTDFTSGAKDIINLTAGTNAIIGGAGNDEITAGAGQNTILGDDGTASFFPNGDLELIESINLGNGGIDTIQLNDGTNTVIAGANADIINMGGGTNFVFADEGRRETTATKIIAQSLNASDGGKDQITVGPGYNVIAGGADEDTITVNGSTPTARGIVLGDNGEMTLDLAGNLLDITSTEFASGAKDIINLTAGTNAIIGGAGNDEITAGAGQNTILGDDGTASFFPNGDLELIESINLGNGGIDTIQLNDGTNTVIAGANADIINMGGGTNFVFADEGRRETTATNIIAQSLNASDGGKDQITVGPGYNVIAGGADEDTITVNGSTPTARGIVLGDNGEMTLDLAGNLLEITSTDFTSGAKDIINLTAGTNAIIGGAGNDEITAGAGQNTILGDDGTASFFANGDLELIESINLGNGGIDTIQLNDGTNTVIAGAESDIISMGGGTNFVFADEGRRETTATNIIAESLNASDGGPGLA